jgi:hypothetical protein
MKIVTSRLNQIVNDRLADANIKRVGHILRGEGAHAREFHIISFALRAAALAVFVCVFF